MKMVKKQNKFVCVVFLAILVFSLFAGEIFQAKADFKSVQTSGSEIDPPFSIFHISDTQYLTSNYPDSLTELMNWIVDNYDLYNCEMVIHTGDFINSNNLTQVQTASTANTILLNNSIPYVWNAGNHEQYPYDDPNGTWLADGYLGFDVSVMQTKSYWVSDLEAGKNTATEFTVGSYHFICINIENEGNSTVIAWMENIIASNPTAYIIVSTHAYRGRAGLNAASHESWTTAFSATLDKYPNVILVLCGHAAISWNQWLGMTNNRVESMFDFQNNLSYYPLGADSVQIFTFDMPNSVVHVRTYLVYNDTFLQNGYGDSYTDTWYGAYRELTFKLNLNPSAGVTIGTSTANNAIREASQGAGFTAAGLNWTFLADGTDAVFSTSADNGATWSAPTIWKTAVTSGWRYSVRWFGTYAGYAYTAGQTLKCRLFTPNANGTVTWLTAENSYDLGSGHAGSKPDIGEDSSGNIYISYTDTYGDTYPYVIRTQFPNGTFGTIPSGFPYQLSATTSTTWMTEVVPLTSGKMAVLYGYDSAPLRIQTYSGSAWNVEKQTTSSIAMGLEYSACAEGDNVHIVFDTVTTLNIMYVKYTYNTNTLGTEVTVKSGSKGTSVALGLDPVIGDLYCIFLSYNGGNYVGYRRYTHSISEWDSWDTIIVAENSTTNKFPSRQVISLFPYSGGAFGVVYVTKTVTPWNVKFAEIITSSAKSVNTFTLGNALTISAGQNVFIDSSLLGRYPIYLGVYPTTSVTVTLTSLNTTTPSIQFTADGANTLYNFSWSWNMPIIQQASGQITSFETNGYDSETLTFTIGAMSATTSTTQVYCGDKGQPVTITPLSADGGYDADTGIQTLVWTHASSQAFTLDWTPIEGDGDGGGGGGGTTLYRLVVKVLKDSAPVPQASVSVGSDTSATDSEGVASFSLRRGVYAVTVNFGDETQTKQVDLRSDAEVTFTLASGWSFPQFPFQINLPSIDDATMRTIVFVCAILLIMLLLIRKKKIK